MDTGNLSTSEEPGLPSKGQFFVYRAEDGRVKIEVRLENETVCLSQQHMAELFQSSKQNVGQHLKNIFDEGELAEDSVVKNFFTTAADGKQYRTRHYNLDAIISVGYRVKSAVATRFRIWATKQQLSPSPKLKKKGGRNEQRHLQCPSAGIGANHR